MIDLETAYQQNPRVGRGELIDLTGCSAWTAQKFLAEKRKGDPPPSAPSDKYDFLDKLPPHEIDALRKSITSSPPKHTPHFYKWSKSSFKFAALADTHIGHELSHRRWWDSACTLVESEKCDFAVHVGDITEGMSGRPGHFFELVQIGTNAQVQEAIERFKQFPVPIKGITGNHDLWAFKTVGADPGAMIATAIPDRFEYLGMNEADIDVQGIKIKPWHGGDGSSYATSYRTQKFVEGLTGGEKPHILLSGHAHKAIFHQCRNVMVFECGTFCGQTGWMRGKKLAAHCGFWIIEVWPNETGIERLKSEWVPFFA